MKKILLVAALMVWAGLAHAGTMTFDTGSGYPLSYPEDGMTVTSMYPPSGNGHLHFDAGPVLHNHAYCCSTPYEFTTGGTFTVNSFDFLSYGSGGFFGYNGSTLLNAYIYGYTGSWNTVTLNWSGIDRLVWDETTDNSYMDNLTFNGVPEPGTLALLGAGLLGLGFRRRRS